MDEIYIPRRLVVEDRTYSEDQLLRMGRVFIVLAEPGGGKTALLGRLGSSLGSPPMRASVFRSRQVTASKAPLVIDAMDEVARTDRLALDDIVVKASAMQSDTVVFAGRSSEWDQPITEHVKNCFGVDPVVVRLEPFMTDEQRQLFEAKFPGEVFEDFVQEAGRFELVPLFGNPQFLQLFGEAYVESGRSFTSKEAIFADAVRRLAHEANKTVSQKGRPPRDRIIRLAGEVFAKLMLSGASGVSATEALDAGEFPYLTGIVLDTSQEARYLVDTRLFKPSADAGQHEPVHRIVAEYCAARYLVGRTDNPRDLLSLPRVLAVVAPNNVVRTELRGMLGWMAALSGESTQTTLVELDPYAVLANGDPSQLTAKAKKALLTKLGQVARDDPFFRRRDVWRQFNVGGFFTPDIQADVAQILNPSGVDHPLRQLVLELIHSSGGASQFESELRALALDPHSPSLVRRIAHSALLDVVGDPVVDLAKLRAEASAISLELAADIVREVGAAKVTVPVVVGLLRALAELYPKRLHTCDELSGSRYFIRTFVESLDLPVIVAALDDLTYNLVCTCTPRYDALCECRGGVSRVAGHLLDRHFTLCTPADAETLWGWLRNLRFRDYRASDRSAAVTALADAHALRREIQWIALTENPDTEKINDAMGRLFADFTHSGICFRAGDMEALAERAFAEGNVTVWGALWCPHNRYDASSRGNPMRTRQRAHTRQKAAFMAEWAQQTARRRAIDGKHHFRIRSRRRRRFEAREERIEEENRNSLANERVKIEAGEHWGWLRHFALLYLRGDEKLTDNPEYGDTPIRALRNCVPFLTPHVPTLQDLGARKGTDIAKVLLAHCIVRFRDEAPLSDLSQPILRAAATEMARYPTIKDEAERKALDAEFECLVFAVPGAPEEFARDFIEPAVALAANIARVHWLDDKPAFHHLRVTLPLEWLDKYPQMPLQQAGVVFQMAADHGDRAQLSALIDRRFNDPCNDGGEDTEADKLARARHRYWALNAFFYNTAAFDRAWEELRHDKDTLLAIRDRVDVFGDDREQKVPTFSTEKIYRVMDSFVGKWPKVPLPSMWGSGSPRSELAYRFLHDLAWRLGSNTPSRKLPVIERMLEDERFADYQTTLIALRAEARHQLALQDFKVPSPADVCALLDHNDIASVEDLRALLIEQLAAIQVWLKGTETDPLKTFYSDGKHVDENTGRNRVVDFLSWRMTPFGLSVEIERHMAAGNRCDFSVSATVSGMRRLLVVEVKGQWNKELFTAASAQLMDRYSIHPDAAGQGIFLVLWFGDEGDSIAGKVDPAITSAGQLKEAILAQMSEELKAVIDIVVLDVSRPATVAKPLKKECASKRKTNTSLR